MCELCDSKDVATETGIYCQICGAVKMIGGESRDASLFCEE